MKKHILELEQNKISKLIASYSIPAIIGMLVTASYNIVDRIFVGRGVGTLAISGISITFPIFIIILGFGQLIGMGATSIISISLGEKNYKKAEQVLGNAFVLIFLISLSLAALIYFFIDPLLTTLGATGEVLYLAKAYLSIIVFGFPFQFILFSLNGPIRAQGSPVVALSTMLVSVVVNTVLNPIFIFGFHWGIKGSALATIIAQFIGAMYVLFYYFNGNSLLKIKLQNLILDKKIVLLIFSIGVSPLIMQLSNSIVTFVFNKSLYIYGGDIAVAAMGISFSIMNIFLMPIYGLNQGIQPIIGYNYGALKIKRVKEALRKGMTIATIICCIGFLCVMLFSYNIMSAFTTNDTKLIVLGSHALKIMLLTLPIAGFQIVSWAYFQAVGKPKQAIILTLTKQIVLYFPLILILPHFFKLEGIWMTPPIADCIAACLTGTLLFIEIKRLRKMDTNQLIVAEQ